MILSPTHMTMGNVLSGNVVDTTIVWKRDKSIRHNDSTYLLSYNYTWPGYNWLETKVVDQIKYDTLIIEENGADGFDSFYTKIQ